jgi:hypothetical protein
LAAENRKIRRTNLIERLGGCCTRCGFSDERALQIDHINGGGCIELSNGLNHSTAEYYNKVIENPDLYQLLCANCNWIKRFENGEDARTNPRVRNIPTIFRPKTLGRHTPESNARRSETMKAYWVNKN